MVDKIIEWQDKMTSPACRKQERKLSQELPDPLKSSIPASVGLKQPTRKKTQQVNVLNLCNELLKAED